MKFCRTCITLFAFIATLIITSGCKNDHVWNESSNKVSVDVRKTLKNYYKDINAEGFMAEFRYLDSSDLFSWHPPGYDTFISYDSVSAILKRNALQYRKVQLTWDSLEIIPETELKARYQGYTSAILTDTTGKKDKFHLYEEGMLMKRENGWKLVSGKTVVREQ